MKVNKADPDVMPPILIMLGINGFLCVPHKVG